MMDLKRADNFTVKFKVSMTFEGHIEVKNIFLQIYPVYCNSHKPWKDFFKE